MRFAERNRCGVALVALITCVAGCATPVQPTTTSTPAVTKAQMVRAPVSPAAHRVFDDARRALKAGRWRDAERGFLALTRSNPELGGPHANLGIIYREHGKLDDAVAELERAVRVSPDQPVYYNQLGIAYRQQGQFRKARTAYEEAIDLDPNYAAACLNLGILSDLYLWDTRRALEMYDRYLVLAGADDRVSKWIVDIKNRNVRHSMLSRKELE